MLSDAAFAVMDYASMIRAEAIHASKCRLFQNWVSKRASVGAVAWDRASPLTPNPFPPIPEGKGSDLAGVRHTRQLLVVDDW